MATGPRRLPNKDTRLNRLMLEAKRQVVAGLLLAANGSWSEAARIGEVTRDTMFDLGKRLDESEPFPAIPLRVYAEQLRLDWDQRQRNQET